MAAWCEGPSAAQAHRGRSADLHRSRPRERTGRTAKTCSPAELAAALVVRGMERQYLHARLSSRTRKQPDRLALDFNSDRRFGNLQADRTSEKPPRVPMQRGTKFSTDTAVDLVHDGSTTTTTTGDRVTVVISLYITPIALTDHTGRVMVALYGRLGEY